MTIRFKPYPEYKSYDSGPLSELPSSWEMRKLKFISQVRPSNVDKKTEAGQLPVRLCNYNDVYKNEYIDNSFEFMNATATPEEIETFQIRKDDVIITKDSEDWLDIAVPSLVEAECPKTLCGYHLAIIRPDSQKSDGRFLLRAFQSAAVNHQFRVSANGITRFGLSKSAISSSVLPVPPLLEQRAIADFLDRETARIDGIIEKEKKLIELLKEKRSALITRAVTKGLDPNVKMKPSGVSWIEKVPEHWTIKKIKFVADFVNGFAFSSDEYTDLGAPIIRIGDLQEHIDLDNTKRFPLSKLQSLGKFRIQRGDLLVALTGATIGKAFDYDLDDLAYLNQRVGILRGREVFNRYLSYFIRSYLVNEIIGFLCNGGAQENIGKPQVGNIYIPIPPRQEQLEISEYLDAKGSEMNSQLMTVSKQADLLKEYKQSLITAAVTGKIDVRGVSNA